MNGARVAITELLETSAPHDRFADGLVAEGRPVDWHMKSWARCFDDRVCAWLSAEKSPRRRISSSCAWPPIIRSTLAWAPGLLAPLL